MKAAVVIRHLFLSSGHNFFGRYGQSAGDHAMTDVAEGKCRAGLGLEGDRFFGYKPDYNGQVTFFAWEVYEAAKRELGVPALSPDAFRRNVIVEGADLRALIGQRFLIGEVEFEGMGESKPCHWMNQAVAPGAENWLKGNGGLRAKVVRDGVLRRGPAELQAAGLLAFG